MFSSVTSIISRSLRGGRSSSSSAFRDFGAAAVFARFEILDAAAEPLDGVPPASPSASLRDGSRAKAS